MRETTTISGYMMRFPRIPANGERNNKEFQENACGLFTSIPHIQLGLKHSVAYQSKCLQNRDSKHADTEKFQADSHPFRMCKEFFLLHNESTAICKTILPSSSLKYPTIATITHHLEKKFLSAETSIFPNISKVVEKSEN